MPDVESRILGKVEASDNSLFHFDSGLMGFEEYRDFYLLSMGDDAPFSVLQSKDDKDTGFILIDPFGVFNDYKPDIHDDDIKSLEIKEESDISLLTIVTIKTEDKNSITTNLLGPILFNVKNNKAKQCIVAGNDYTTRHNIVFASADEAEEGK